MELRGEIRGPPDTPYADATFILDILIPDTYPFNPPKVHLVCSVELLFTKSYIGVHWIWIWIRPDIRWIRLRSGSKVSGSGSKMSGLRWEAGSENFRSGARCTLSEITLTSLLFVIHLVNGDILRRLSNGYTAVCIQ